MRIDASYRVHVMARSLVYWARTGSIRHREHFHILLSATALTGLTEPVFRGTDSPVDVDNWKEILLLVVKHTPPQQLRTLHFPSIYYWLEMLTREEQLRARGLIQKFYENTTEQELADGFDNAS